MRPDMLFQTGSMEKNFTATLMLQLVEEGRLSLDDPISRWVSGYEQIDPSITIRQLLNHTSGIYDWEDNPRSFTGLYLVPFRWVDRDALFGLLHMEGHTAS